MRFFELTEQQKIRCTIAPHESYPDCWMVSAFIDGKEVGWLSLGPNRFDNGQYSAMMVSVEPEYRRMGVASAMYSYAHRKGIKPIVPDTPKMSDDAHAFWGKHLQPTINVSKGQMRYPKREWNPRRANPRTPG